ncbi:unnamed protein product, partial [Rotaria magnacalcarata]
MVAFAEVGATVAPSIGDDSDEEESSASAIESVDQELIRPLIHIVEEASGCVSTIEERLRATHSNESNQPASNGAVGGGGSWVLGNKTNLYPAIDCPGVNIVPNTCYFSGVLNNNGTTTLSNSSLSGVSNNSVIHSNSNVDTSTSNSCEVICNISTQYSNVAAATGINNSSIKCMDALNSKVATNNCINTLSNHSIERGARDENNFWGVENEPLSPPATMPAHTYTGWEQPEENSQNSQNSVSLNDGVCTPLYREQ